MKLINKSAICAVKSKEAVRLRKWQERQDRIAAFLNSLIFSTRCKPEQLLRAKPIRQKRLSNGLQRKKARKTNDTRTEKQMPQNR